MQCKPAVTELATLPPVPPPGKIWQNITCIYVYDSGSIMWKHDAVLKTGST